ncbi:hypothetical protein JRO89_XS02G0205300 [Xanthoceras sorbifolium]|uniref:Kinetochore protein Nuf2 N-terminal domain-containing protein n=1 Tax=Xanthoceras sorbifolium TaxID=99658 RepID=A0ABQ8IGC3_9ROSI|nr:hypothetical protein JRO89_XS02G0205300 [Xanthoceras sorbifolium]
MSKFEYPKLSMQEIISVLAESQIAAITDKDLKNPSPDFISDLYTRLLIYLDILHEEDHGQLDFAALDQLENPDHHVGSVQTMTLYSRIKEVVTSIGCPMNFTLKDLIRSDAARTEYFVSAILNFCLHNLGTETAHVDKTISGNSHKWFSYKSLVFVFNLRDTKMNLLRPIAEDLTDLDEQRKEWEAKISKLNAEIAEYNEAREKELPLVQELDAKVKELRQTIQDLNKHQAEFDLVQSVQQNADLRSKIVQSPDKLQRALEEKKLVRQEAKDAERLAMQSFQNKNETLDVYTEALEKMLEHFAQMQAVYEQENVQVNSAKSIEREYKALKAKVSDDGVLDKSLEAKLVERQAKGRFLFKLSEQLDELRKQLERERNLKFEEVTKELDNVKLDVESTRRDLEARQRKVEAVVAEVDAITSKTLSIKEAGAAKLQELDNKAEEIVKQVCSSLFLCRSVYVGVSLEIEIPSSTSKAIPTIFKLSWGPVVTEAEAQVGYTCNWCILLQNQLMVALLWETSSC